MHNEDRYKKFLESYLEEYYLDLSTEDIEKFKKLGVKKNSSCIVVCKDVEILKKFVNFYLLQKTYNNFATYDANIYVSDYSNYNVNTQFIDVLIINYNKNVIDYGNSVKYMHEVLAETVSSRKWKNTNTIILAEKEPEYLAGNVKVSLLDKIKDEVDVYRLESKIKNITGVDIGKPKPIGEENN